MVTILLATLAMSDNLSCAVMGSPASITTKNAVYYAGARYPFCCGGCDAEFSKEPGKYVKGAAEAKKTIAFFLFDPVSGGKLDLKKMPTLSSDYKGTRFFFANDDEKKSFDADPKKYGVTPDKEVMFCSVMGHEVENYATAGAYADSGGVRYYFCCGDCRAAFVKEPSKYTGTVKDKVQAPKAMKLPNG
jgi:YHS domain-containing protein